MRGGILFIQKSIFCANSYCVYRHIKDEKSISSYAQWEIFTPSIVILNMFGINTKHSQTVASIFKLYREVSLYILL